MQNDMPLISVIVPCFNYGNFLPEAIESALSQRYPNLECIIVDDGSSDNTEEVACKYCKQDVRVKYIKQENQGVASARNTGISIAAGRYILPLDADDRLSPDYATKAVEVLEAKPSVGIVYCDAQFIGSTNAKFELPPYSFPEILLSNQIFASAFFKKQDWIQCGGYNENMRLGWEDWDFWLSLVEMGRAVYKIPEVLFYYRQGHTSRTETANQTLGSLLSQLAKNHPALYIENSQFFFDRLLDAQEKNIQAEALKGSCTYRFLFKYFFKTEKLFKKLLSRS